MVASEALAAGTVTRQQLRTRYVKLYRDVYAPVELELTACDWAYGAWLWSGRKATLVGNSAAALHGTKWIDAWSSPVASLRRVPRGVHEPAELGRSRETQAWGIVVRSGFIADDEIVTCYGIPCTGPARTGYDIGRLMEHDASILRLDAVMNATGCGVADIERIAERYPRARGVRRLRAALALADGGAESPQESRLRLILVRGGLGPIATQIPVTEGRRVRRIDMGWPEWKVGVEYDGEQHWSDPRVDAETPHDDVRRHGHVIMWGFGDVVSAPCVRSPTRRAEACR